MRLPLSWLKDYMNTDGIENAEYMHKMTMSGSIVEGIENAADEFKNVVTGKILKIEKHPDADKLVVCQVDVGEDAPIQIVTGATNVFEGAVVPVAKHKSTLPGGVKITKGKLRGVESFGMMCSTDELGISEERATGILILSDDTPIGEDITKVLGLDENVAEFEITSNRPDCMSIIGLARETAATFNRPFNVNVPQVKENSENAADMASVEIRNTDLCSRYIGRIVKNVKIAPSPEWMQKRLKACGIRAINNVVDITNYVMLEYGQPMHAYDLDHVEGKKIIVRNAEKDEKLETLDDQPRILGESMIVIADEKRAIGVAGVMGGANSEVCDDTTTVLFESACFNAAAVRKGAKALGMRTDASALFEKGLDSENCLPAINRACELMVQLGAGEVVGGIIDEYPIKKQQLVLDFEPEKMNAFLGMDIPCDEMVEMLARLDFKVENDKVYVPTYRGDIEGMADISEEVARIYGYDRIPTTLMKGEMVAGGKTDKQKLRDTVRNCLAANGLYEIITYSFIDPKENAMVRIPEDDSRSNFVRITNPLGAENSVMRTDMTSSLLKTLRTNYTRRNAQAALFELGTIFTPIEGEQLPRETQQIAVGMYGEYDFYSIKGVIEALFEKVGIYDCIYVACKDNPTYHGGRCAEIMSGDKKLGIIGQIHPSVSAEFKIDTDVYAAIIDFEVLSELADMQRHYVPLPKFPAVTRDIAVTLDKDVEVGEIVKIIKANRKGIIESYNLFDIYEGIQVGKGKKSVAYSLTFRSADKTLTDDDVNPIVNTILKQLEEKLGAQLR
ncbi:MAG: phenylalanine--tRNA ligase subunit beta [Eubacteriales bacterium]|nr:phenylalanine--tRNA ligase subunit beta [Eubacteriales bacterium]MDY4212510.1 phenylalanine--tRNA ligase subunit beta [Eubacteriales bacterium]MDY5230263.1 phenylalanine--tRNA ligase subunit beta [Eubacteriales bacterium]